MPAAKSKLAAPAPATRNTSTVRSTAVSASQSGSTKCKPRRDRDIFDPSPRSPPVPSPQVRRVERCRVAPLDGPALADPRSGRGINTVLPASTGVAG